MSKKNYQNDMQFFGIRAVKFDTESQKEDPFYFEQTATKIAKRYIPFSGYIRKRRYILFRYYVDWIIDNKKLPDFTDRDIRIRFEKLLVYCWSECFKVKKKGILGITKEANPFAATKSDWIKIDCYKAYNKQNVNLILEHEKNEILKYFEEQFKDEKSLLQNFMRCSDNGKEWRKKLKKIFFDKILKLKSKKSLFQPKLHKDLSNLVLSCIKKTIKNANPKNQDKISDALRSFNVKAIESLIEPGNDNAIKKYDNEVKAYILKVDKQIQYKSQSSDWKQFKEIKGAPVKPRKGWFTLDNGIYRKTTDHQWEFENDWKRLVKKAKRKDCLFFDFRVPALLSLIKDDKND